MRDVTVSAFFSTLLLHSKSARVRARFVWETRIQIARTLTGLTAVRQTSASLPVVEALTHRKSIFPPIKSHIWHFSWFKWSFLVSIDQ